MNILVICREIPPVGGGAGHVAIHLAEEVARQGHRVEIVTMHFGDLPRVENKGEIRIHRVPCGRRNQDSSYLLEMARFNAAARSVVRGIIGDAGCDVVHAHAIVPDGLIGAAVARERRIPLVVTAHGSDVPGYNPDKFKLAHVLMRPFWHRTLNRAAAVVTPSNHLAAMLRDVRPRQDVRVIPNGIQPDTFAETEKDNAFLIVSRLVRRKNFHVFLEALRSVDAPQTVHIVGEGPMLDELKRIAASLQQHNVVFHGWLENGSNAWRELYQRSRYFVFPSESENFPINLLEAQLAGMIVLTNRIPGICEVVGEEAVFFEQLSVEGVAATIDAVLSGRIPGVDTLGQRARARVIENFSWPFVAEQYLHLYREARGEAA